MTTIDRIMNKLRNFYVPADEKYIRQILEAELTAVKGVDEHIKILKGVIENASINMWYEMQLRKVLKYLKSLKQTPVAEEYPCTECWWNAYEWYIVPDGNCKIAKWERLCKKCMEKRNPDFIEQEKQLNYSQPKEVDDICPWCWVKWFGCICSIIKPNIS